MKESELIAVLRAVKAELMYTKPTPHTNWCQYIINQALSKIDESEFPDEDRALREMREYGV